MKASASVVVVMGCAVLLAGCGSEGGASRFFGLTHNTPDAFTVTTQPPLTIPPTFALRPPEPGAPRPQAVSEREAAEAVLAPQTAINDTASPGMSAGQSALLQAAGPPAPGDIRQQIAAANHKAAEPGFVDELMFWRSPAQQGVAVDPAKEQQRIRANQALGRPMDTGDTPIIQRNKSLFDTLF